MTFNRKILPSFVWSFVICSVLSVLVLWRYEQDISNTKLKIKSSAYFDWMMQSDSISTATLDSLGLVIYCYNEAGCRIQADISNPDSLYYNSADIATALRSGEAYGRHKNKQGRFYFYYIRYDKQHHRYIQIVQPYNNTSEWHISHTPIYITILIFFIAGAVSCSYVMHKYGTTIQKLKNLIGKVNAGDRYNFPEGEFKEISEYIVSQYKSLEKTEKALNMEREKFKAHLRISKRGIAIFSPQRKEILSNELFIQYINLIADKQCRYPESVFDIPEFNEIIDFLDESQRNDSTEMETKTVHINKRESIIIVHCIMFHDKSFEITVEDVTQKEEQAMLKRQLTQNISHELKTPVTSIQGYMETLRTNPDIDEEKRKFFIDRCYAQAVRLTYLLQDISTLNKLDEASEIFAKEPVNLHEIINGVLQDVALQLEEKQFKVDCDLPAELMIEGNQSLLYSIFRNLTDNSLHYAGTNIQITISCYRTDNEFYYFSFADNGVGIDETHLSRIFDRFYRVDKGRSRKLGGTGLGLAIVKNAIVFHQGRISAKPHAGGGVEFLFTLRKKSSEH
ncbi:MAG: two-component sensor histidine kinase [Paludibacteraceae bacterium]|nr:two-component sensor histidine kinase [Paludibacteraceae bacterium]